MSTKEEILKEIENFREEPMTPQSISVFANLLYIRDHWCKPGENVTVDSQKSVEPLTEEVAQSWVSTMKNADGTVGRHWTMEQTEQVRVKMDIPCSPVHFWVAMNMMYSDYCKIAEKMGVNTAEFYACMAKAFLADPDAQPDKLARYHEYIAEH